MTNVRIDAFRQPWDDGVRLYITTRSLFVTGETKKQICTNLQFETVEFGREYPDNAAIMLQRENAQVLMDSL